MIKIDLKKELKHLYRPSAKEVSVVDVPPFNYVMIDGRGSPAAHEYSDALEALYPVAYTLKFMMKKEMGIDYVVMPLQGLWWTPDMADFSVDDKDAWFWTMMILQPEAVTQAMLVEAMSQVAEKKDPPALHRLRLDILHEGPAAQILYTGAYADEGPTIKQIHEFIAAGGHELHGKHHEIYLSDPRRTAPERLKTVIRQPFK